MLLLLAACLMGAGEKNSFC